MRNQISNADLLALGALFGVLITTIAATRYLTHKNLQQAKTEFELGTTKVLTNLDVSTTKLEYRLTELEYKLDVRFTELDKKLDQIIDNTTPSND